MTSMMESYQQSAQLELINALLADKNMPTMPDRGALFGEGSKEQQFGNLKNAVLGKVRDALALVSAKASPEELAAYKQMIVTVAEETVQGRRFPGFWR